VLLFEFVIQMRHDTIKMLFLKYIDCIEFSQFTRNFIHQINMYTMKSSLQSMITIFLRSYKLRTNCGR